MRFAGRHVLIRTAIILIAAVPPSLHAAGPVRDLYYGEALFHFYQDEHFIALSNLLTARNSGRIPNHADDAELLLGGLYLSYGQHARAADIFQRLLDTVQDAQVRSRAWFYLGKVRYQRGLAAEALRAFESIDDPLPEALDSERVNLVAQSRMMLGDFSGAASELDRRLRPDVWSAYADYNLGVALIRSGRAEAGFSRLDRIGQMAVSGGELIGLRDQANVALGYAYLQSGRPAEAREVLQRVRLDGPLSNKALLGAGWADAAQSNFRSALNPWRALQDRDLLDSAVQEAMLAVPFAFQQLDANGSAADSYRVALDVISAELEGLDEAIDRARSGEMVKALLNRDDSEIGRWYWELDAVPDTQDSRYLYHIIADHRFQEGLRNSRDLLAVKNHFELWRDKLAVFREMVDTRAQAYGERLPVVQAQLSGMDILELQERRNEVADRVEKIELSRDVMGLASPEQMAAWSALDTLKSNPAFSLPGQAAARDKHRILKGTLLWAADRDYRFRLWQRKQEIKAVDIALQETSRRSSAVMVAQTSDPRQRNDWLQKLDELEHRIKSTLVQTARVISSQSGELELIAVRELEQRRDRLMTYRVQAQFALAALYDRATAAVTIENDPR